MNKYYLIAYFSLIGILVISWSFHFAEQTERDTSLQKCIERIEELEK